MKLYVKASKGSSKVTGKSWNEFLQNIEDQTHYTIDSAYRRERNNDTWLLLYDPEGISYTAEYTKYFKGGYELMLYNIRRNNYQSNY